MHACETDHRHQDSGLSPPNISSLKIPFCDAFLDPTSLLPLTVSVRSLELYVHGIMPHGLLILWLLLFSVTILRFTHVLYLSLLPFLLKMVHLFFCC